MAPKITQDLIPQGRRNRPGYKLVPKYVTVHDTANTDAGANAKAHAGYLKGAAAAAIPASWHFTVDDKVIYQHLPPTENGWHAGDGTNGTGNRQSIGIEICENRDGNRVKAEANAAWLAAKLIREVKTLRPFPACMKQHYDWSKKNCPAQIRVRKNGWTNFLKQVENYLKPAQKPAIPDGGLYRVQVGAYTQKANAEAMLARLKKAGFDAIIVTEGAAGAPTAVTAPAEPVIKKGSKVRVKKGAKDYNGVRLASFVFAQTYDVIQITGDRVVIGQGKVVTAAVKMKDLVVV